MKRIILILVGVFVLIACLPSEGSAQAKKSVAFVPPIKGVEWWDTLDECENATNFIYYVPRTVSTKAPPKDLVLVLGGLPEESCVRMPLPEIGMKEGVVRQEVGAPYYFRLLNGKLVPVLRKECLNSAAVVRPVKKKDVISSPNRTEIVVRAPEPQPLPIPETAPALPPSPPVIETTPIQPAPSATTLIGPKFLERFSGELFNLTDFQPWDHAISSRNVVDRFIVRERMKIIGLGKYVSVNGRADLRNFYAWKDAKNVAPTKEELGGRLGLELRFNAWLGWVNLYAGASRAYRQGILGKPNGTEASEFFLGEARFGWDEPDSRATSNALTGSKRRMPGHVYLSAGNLESPYERNDVIMRGFVRQGVLVKKAAGVSIAPGLRLEVIRDTKKFSYYNRGGLAAEVCLSVPWTSGLLNLCPGYGSSRQTAGPWPKAPKESRHRTGFSPVVEFRQVWGGPKEK